VAEEVLGAGLESKSPRRLFRGVVTGAVVAAAEAGAWAGSAEI
jgi:hypothetical protein